MLVTNVGDSFCWGQVRDDVDRFMKFVTFFKLKKVANIMILPLTSQNFRRYKVTNILLSPKFATIENKPNSCNIDSSMRNNDEFIHGFNGITVDFTSTTFFRFSSDDISAGSSKNEVIYVWRLKNEVPVLRIHEHYLPGERLMKESDRLVGRFSMPAYCRPCCLISCLVKHASSI